MWLSCPKGNKSISQLDTNSLPLGWEINGDFLSISLLDYFLTHLISYPSLIKYIEVSVTFPP